MQIMCIQVAAKQRHAAHAKNSRCLYLGRYKQCIGTLPHQLVLQSVKSGELLSSNTMVRSLPGYTGAVASDFPELQLLDGGSPEGTGHCT